MDSTNHLKQFGLNQPYKSKVIVSESWFKKLFSDKSTHVYGNKEYKEYIAQLKKCNDLVKFCGKNYLFKPIDWKNNDVDWSKEMKLLVLLAEKVSAIKKKEIEMRLSRAQKK